MTSEARAIRIPTPTEAQTQRSQEVANGKLKEFWDQEVEYCRPLFFDDKKPPQFEQAAWNLFQVRTKDIFRKNQDYFADIFIKNPDVKVTHFAMGMMIQNCYLKIFEEQRQSFASTASESSLITTPKLEVLRLGSEIIIPGSADTVEETDWFTGEKLILAANNIILPESWDEVEGIHRTRGVAPEKSEDLRFFVELPLYQAVRMLFDAGIKTTESNAHFTPGFNETNIGLTIYWDSLSPLQQNAARLLTRTDSSRWSIIDHPDGYTALSLNWIIKKDQVSPRQVRMYVNSAVRKLVEGRIVLTGRR